MSARHCWYVAALVALLAAVTLGSLHDDAFMANDAAQYIEAAKNLRQGSGYATALLYYDQHYQVGGLPARQTVWPPLFPALIALVSRAGAGVDHAAFLVALACYLLIAVVLLATLRRMGHAPGPALILSSLWYLFALPWGNVLHHLSDMTFALFTLLSLYCLVTSDERAGRQRAWLLLAGLAASLAFATRYAGIFYIASIGTWFGVRWLFDRRRETFTDLFALMLVPVLTVAGFFLHNYSLTGTMTGGADPHTGGSLAMVFDKHLTLVSKVFGFSDDGFLEARPAEMLFAAFAALGVVYVVWRRDARQALWKALAVTRWHRASQLSLVYIVLTLFVLSVFGLTKLTGYLHPRYMIPLIPFGILVLAQIVPIAPDDRQGLGHVARAVLLLAAAAFLAGQTNVARAVWASGTSDSLYLALVEDLRAPIDGNSAQDFLRSRASLQSPVLGNESQMLGYILDRPALGTAPANYSARVWDTAAIRQLCEDYRVGYVVFFRERFDANDPWNANLTFLAALGSGQVPPWLDRIVETDALMVYRVDHGVL